MDFVYFIECVLQMFGFYCVYFIDCIVHMLESKNIEDLLDAYNCPFWIFSFKEENVTNTTH